VKKDIQNRLRASVRAEDLAVRDRFSSVDALLRESRQPAAEPPPRETARARRPAPGGAGGAGEAERTPPPVSREHAGVIRRVRERLLRQGIALSTSELAMAGIYALVRASDEEIHETVERLRGGGRGRPVFPSGRGGFHLSRFD